jgi:putative thioredoxin
MDSLRTAQPDPVMDSSEAGFANDVIEASRTVPVIVDFWATWCGPCKTLGPSIEAAVRAQRGKVRLVKIDVDKNQRISQQMRIQSIPAVYAFVDGRPVDGFMGALPPGQVKEFVERVAGMGPAAESLDEALAAADAMLAEGAVADAAQTFAAILAEEPGNAHAIAGLARSHVAAGDTARAEQVLAMVPKEKSSDPAVLAARAAIDLAVAGSEAGDVRALRAAVEAEPGDLQARFDLATALAAARKNEEAIDLLLDLFRRDREWNEGAAKTQLFKLFDSLGPKHEAVLKGRRRLSSMIFA